MINNQAQLDRAVYWLGLYKADLEELEKETLIAYKDNIQWNKEKIAMLEKEIEDYQISKGNKQ